MKATESFKEYAIIWRGVAAQVQPPLLEEEISYMFHDSLPALFFELMLENSMKDFEDLVTNGELIENVINKGNLKVTLKSPTDQEAKADKTTGNYIVPKGWFKGANPSLTVTDSRIRHITGVVIQETKNPEVRLWSEKTQKEKGDNLQESYVSELKFIQRYSDIALLLHVRIDEPLIRAMVQFWNPRYSCFTFNWEDMVPTIEEYTTLLHCENIKLGRVYVKHTKSQPFKSILARVAGVDEKWVIDRTQRRGSGEGIEWIHIRQLMKNHPDEWKTIDFFALGLYGLIIFPKALGYIDAAVVELFEQLLKQVNPAPAILAETVRSLNHCRRVGGGRFIGCVQLLQVWIHNHFWKTNGVAYRRFSTTYSPLGEFITMKWHEGASKEKWMKGSDTMTLLGLWGAVGYAPLLALRQYGARQFVPATCGLSGSEFGYHGNNYKKMIKEAADSWKKIFRMDIVAAKNMLTPDYVEWRRLRKNDNIPAPDCKDTRTMEEYLRPVPSELEIAKTEFEAVNNELRQTGKGTEKSLFRARRLKKGVSRCCQRNSKLKMSSEYWKGEAHNLKRKFEGPDDRAWKEKMKIAQRHLADSQHQNQRLRIQMTDLEKQHERDGKTIAQQRVKAKDAAIRDFLDQVQKAARHLHGMAREAGVNMSQKAKEKTPSLPLQTLNTHHPHNTRAKKRQMEPRMEKLEENMARLQKELEDKMAQNSQSTLESIKKNQKSLVDQIVAKLSCLQQVSAEGGSPFEGVTMSPTSQVIMSPEILPRPQENSSAVKGKAPSAVKVQTSKTNPDNHPDDYSISDFNEDDKEKKMEEKIRMIEDRMKIVQGDHDYYGMDARELSLVPDLVLPPKFKAPEFEKFDGNSCPSAHITMFCRKMTGYGGNDQLLIHCFQESLSGSAIHWYNQLNQTHIKTWKDLAKSFLEQYKHINDMRPDRVMLQSLEKKHNESFRQYAQRWRDLSVQVHPPLDEKETRKLFVQTLKAPYFEHLVAITSELSRSSYGCTSKQTQRGPRKEKICISPIPMTYEELLPTLVEKNLVTLVQSKTREAPYPEGHDIYAVCSYHIGSSGHTTENCGALKRKVQDLIDSGAFTFNMDDNDLHRWNSRRKLESPGFMNRLCSNYDTARTLGNSVFAPLLLSGQRLCHEMNPSVICPSKAELFH
ncbi:hypothetical protein F3Y22_tig00111843pilonHSYRG00112 [Hibiscus syriacus]|uniref:Retrotransposon gag domain-containing protein n=1 Tax=Hibiscus syriacus TaxID=106335 RepID=A0A6A2XB00_HIBSY|nr:hypothetical protein F3Y22_tig00111843pilonHSYRG00112 [Hibiscus syriacus]